MAQVQTNIDFSLEFADVQEFKADILVLKYARSYHGVDAIIAKDLYETGGTELKISPEVGEYSLVKNFGLSKFDEILFIGVPHLSNFRYERIRAFTKKALEILYEKKSNVSHIAMTIHGAGYGLDENEAVISQFAGLFEALQSGKYPKYLEKVSIIENNHGRLSRIRMTIDQFLKNNKVVKRKNDKWTYSIQLDKLNMIESNEIVKELKKSETKRHIFVAMPFTDQMIDTFYYGIQAPINANGFLCERIDMDTFIGDILAKLKNEIESASAIIADLTLSNPNVYLEVGYAWGTGKPTVLVVKEGEKLKFDVRGQKCLHYKNIKHLEEILTKEIKGLVEKGEIK